MNVILPAFSARLKELRQKNGLTQTNMAGLLGKTVRHYQAIEAGTVNISATILIFLSQQFDVSIDYLLGLSDQMKREKRMVPLDCNSPPETAD